ncbi:MAG TPA: proton-conducting transporter membrane subunit, partial [Verrucomicrobiota bacterium]|nr:proton-conducting transporter membrane subunit [Verrucomicrobiota bacterium]
ILGLLMVMDPAARGITETNPAATALGGVMLQLFTHGITAAALFACVELLERRTGGDSRFRQLGGLRATAPVFAGLMGIAVFASLGLPGLSGFIGEFLIFAGVFPIAPLAAALALPGLLVSAWFLLNLLQQIFHGPLVPPNRPFADLGTRDIVTLSPAIALMFVLGVFPQLALMFINPSVTQFLARIAP